MKVVALLLYSCQLFPVTLGQTLKLTTLRNFSKNISSASGKNIDEIEKLSALREEEHMRKYPRRFSKTELKKFGVTLENERKLILRCDKCGQGWMVNLKPGGQVRYQEGPGGVQIGVIGRSRMVADNDRHVIVPGNIKVENNGYYR